MNDTTIENNDAIDTNNDILFKFIIKCFESSFWQSNYHFTIVKNRKRFCSISDSEIESIIIKNKNIIDYRNAHGNTVLYLAYIRRIPSIVQLLIKNGANVNTQYENSRTLLMIAIEDDCHYFFDMLISAKDINLDIRDKYGYTAVMKTLIHRNRYVYLRDLYEHGADMMVVNNKGNNLLDIAINSNNYKCLLFLIDKNISSLSIDNYKLDKIMNIILSNIYTKCAYMDNINIFDIIIRLLEHGAKISQKQQYTLKLYINTRNTGIYIRKFKTLFKYWGINAMNLCIEFEERMPLETFKDTQLYSFFIENGFDDNLFSETKMEYPSVGLRKSTSFNRNKYYIHTNRENNTTEIIKYRTYITYINKSIS